MLIHSRLLVIFRKVIAAKGVGQILNAIDLFPANKKVKSRLLWSSSVVLVANFVHPNDLLLPLGLHFPLLLELLVIRLFGHACASGYIDTVCRFRGLSAARSRE